MLDQPDEFRRSPFGDGGRARRHDRSGSFVGNEALAQAPFDAARARRGVSPVSKSARTLTTP